jgi:hypothetical protein
MRSRSTVLAVCRIALAGLALAAVAYELASGLGEPHWSTTDFFSYFTELSNLYAAAILLAAGLAALGGRAGARRSATFELLRGASVLYILTTGIVYAVLLAGHHNTIPWANDVLHRLMPALVTLDWLLDPPHVPLPLRRVVLAWMAFPLLYIGYTLVRGPLAHWYPYFFVEPGRPGGYLRVAANCVAIALGQVAMALAIATVGRLLAARSDAPPPVSSEASPAALRSR